MARYRQVWNEDLGKHEFIEVSSGGKRVDSHYIHEDFKPFVSPIDKEVISGRKQYENHCKRHNVVNSAEFDEGHMRAARKEKDRAYTGERTRQEIQKTREEMHSIITHMERNQ